jgi:eukaryotic-like serine/threonine-protein kinase
MTTQRPDGADRLTIRGILGSGAMGIVYRAYDRRLDRDVAVKKLRYLTGRDLYRFKREFRSLADIVHPNLVTLYELHTAGEDWFVTMELIEGIGFAEWVRHEPAPEGTTITSTYAAGGDVRRALVDAPLDRARLEAALPQLVDGVLALHACGKLHRDLKPPNVLVTPEGRVVLLDFGLVSDLDDSDADRTHRHAAIGTPAYMSPEQAADLRLDEASDWYSVGAMLYEALTGRRPFEGSSLDVLHRKQREKPPAPRILAPGTPPELDALCMRLLARFPRERPDGHAVLAALGRSPSRATLQLERARAPRPFVGRDRELALLRAALADANDHAVAVLVSGESGIGKSQLVRRFLDEVAARALVLEGTCYERESVPFKALDGVIDAVASALLRLPDDDVQAVLPRDVSALARLFPVLLRVPAIAERAATPLPAAPQELRRRAQAALRGLVAGLGARRPVVIAIDDLQWGDADSAAFLRDLIHHVEALPLLVILVHRVEDDVGVVAALRQPPPCWPAGDVRTIEVGPLAESEARHLACALGGGPLTDDVIEEARGHPLFLSELVQTQLGDRDAPTFEALIARRMALLPPGAAQLLRMIAVAGRPLPLIDAARAAGLPGVGTELSLLVAEHLVRLRHLGIDDATHVMPYHERVRTAVLSSLDQVALREAHLALTRVLERAGDPTELDVLAQHCLAAGEPARAARYAVPAAAAAEDALAFHRAAELYALALAHTGGDALERRWLERRRGEALAASGRLDEAAAAFFAAAEGAAEADAIQLDQLRLEQLLRRGHLTDGMALVTRQLARIGIALPAGRHAMVRQLRGQRLRRWRSGYGFVSRSVADLAADEVQRVDLLGAIAMAMAVSDPLTGSVVQGHFLSAALALGEPRRASIALAIELGYLGLIGVRARPRIERLAAEVDELAARIGDPYVIGLVTAMMGLARFQLGEWTSARVHLERGIQLLCDHAHGVRWELDVAELFRLGALAYLGDGRELARAIPMLLRDAMERGDVYAEHALRAWRPNLAWLVTGQPKLARAQLLAAEETRAADRTFQLRHYYELVSQAQIDLYAGDGGTAWSRLDAAWPDLGSSELLRIQTVRVEASFLRARAAIACAAGAEACAMIDVARGVAADLDRERAPWATALARQVGAMIAAAVGDRDGGARRFAEAARAFDDCDMSLHAAVARIRSGELAGGAAGTARAAGGAQALRERGVADPDAFARMLCPRPEGR